jgi:hypothetical protein
MLDTGAHFCLVALLVTLGFVDFCIAPASVPVPEIFGLGRLVVDPLLMASVAAVALHGPLLPSRRVPTRFGYPRQCAASFPSTTAGPSGLDEFRGLTLCRYSRSSWVLQ